jgi:hypothetical protein
VGFGTWRIFVPLFWDTCRLFSIFLLFRILEHFCLWILYTLFTLVLLRHQGEVFYYCGLSKLCLPFVPLRQKRGSIYLFWTENVFLTRSSDFCPRMAKWGVCSFLCWLHYVGQNHFYVMLLLSQGCCFIQSLHFNYELQEDSVQNSNKSVQFPCILPDGILSRRSSVSNIRPHDENFPSGRPSMSRNFEFFKIASVRT